MEIIQLCYSKTLFHGEDGSPMMFCVQPSEDAHHVGNLVEAGGGRIVDDVNQGVIVLSSNGLNLQNRSNVICTSFIYACCFNDTLLDKEGFRLIPGDNFLDESAISTGDNEDSSDKRSNYQSETFSKRKMHDLLVHIIKCEDIWKKIEETKVLGAFNWRCIQKKFCFWALEKLEENALLAHSSVRYDPRPSQDNQEARRDSSALDPIQSSQIDVNAEQCNLIMEKKRENKVGAGVSETDRMDCENKGARDSSTGNEKGYENERRNFVPVCCVKRVAGRCRRAVIVESDESSSDSEKEGMESVQQRVEGRDEVAQGSSGVNRIMEPDRSRCSNVIVKKKEMQKGTDMDSSKWLGKHIRMTPARKNSCALDQSEANNVLNSDNSESSESRNSNEENDLKCQANRPRKRLRLYTLKEDLQMLKWICQKRGRRSGPLTGNRIWKFMEKRKVLEGRSWQSMKERFRRHIVPDLKKYPISQDDLRKLTIEIKDL